MGFVNKLRGELVDIIEWVDDNRNTLVWRFPRYQNEIKNGARLVVRPGQSAIFVDRENIPATYDKWLRRAERTEKEFKRQGTITERVYLDPVEFAGWCATRGRRINAAARMNFATKAVTGKYRNQS